MWLTSVVLFITLVQGHGVGAKGNLQRVGLEEIGIEVLAGQKKRWGGGESQGGNNTVHLCSLSYKKNIHLPKTRMYAEVLTSSCAAAPVAIAGRKRTLVSEIGEMRRRWRRQRVGMWQQGTRCWRCAASLAAEMCVRASIDQPRAGKLVGPCA